jgi:hypothetical protein
LEEHREGLLARARNDFEQVTRLIITNSPRSLKNVAHPCALSLQGPIRHYYAQQAALKVTEGAYKTAAQAERRLAEQTAAAFEFKARYSNTPLQCLHNA